MVSCMIWTSNDYLNIISAAFYFKFVALVVDLLHGYGCSNEICCQLEPK